MKRLGIPLKGAVERGTSPLASGEAETIEPATEPGAHN